MTNYKVVYISGRTSLWLWLDTLLSTVEEFIKGSSTRICLSRIPTQALWAGSVEEETVHEEVKCLITLLVEV